MMGPTSVIQAQPEESALLLGGALLTAASRARKRAPTLRSADAAPNVTRSQPIPKMVDSVLNEHRSRAEPARAYAYRLQHQVDHS